LTAIESCGRAESQVVCLCGGSSGLEDTEINIRSDFVTSASLGVVLFIVFCIPAGVQVFKQLEDGGADVDIGACGLEISIGSFKFSNAYLKDSSTKASATGATARHPRRGHPRGGHLPLSRHPLSRHPLSRLPFRQIAFRRRLIPAYLQHGINSTQDGNVSLLLLLLLDGHLVTVDLFLVFFEVFTVFFVIFTVFFFVIFFIFIF
jgi:hypothetical protein